MVLLLDVFHNYICKLLVQIHESSNHTLIKILNKEIKNEKFFKILVVLIIFTSSINARKVMKVNTTSRIFQRTGP